MLFRSLNFGIKDTEILASVTGSGPYTFTGTGNINVSSRKNGLATDDTVFQSTDRPELLFKVGSPYVASISSTSYETTMLFRNVTFTSGSGNVQATIDFEGPYLNIFKHLGTAGSTLTDDEVRQYYTLIVTDNKSNTNIKNGDIILWESSLGRTVQIGRAHV